MKRLLLLAAVLAVGAALYFTRSARAPYRCPDCNIVLISVDTLRADHLGCYGYGRPTTPNLDAFAAQAALFRSAVAQAPSTEPSHASMLTSLLPSVHGAIFSQHAAIASARPTMAELLRKRGYRTASFNGGGQLDAGFGFNRGFEVYQSFDVSHPEADRFRDRVDQGLRWLDGVRDQRFFLFLHSYEVHHPYFPDREDLELFRGEYRGAVPELISAKFLSRANHGAPRLNDDDRRYIIDKYDAEIHGMDRALATLLAGLGSRGLLDKSIIILTSDHGEELGEHGRMGWHGHTLYDELLHVPLLMRFPNGAFAGSSISAQVRSIDILPTVLEVLDAAPETGFQGKTLIPLLNGSESAADVRYAVSQKDVRHKKLPTSVRTPKWKLYRGKLFDLEADPTEQHDVKDQHPDVFADLQVRAEEVFSAKPAGEEKQAAPLKPETLDQLKSLGYLK